MRHERTAAAVGRLARLVVSVGLFSSLVFLCDTAAGEHVLVDPVTMLDTARRMDFVGRNTFAVERLPEGTFLRSTPHNSASGLYQHVDMDGRALTRVQWSWRVDRLQRSADLRTLASEDSGATVFFIFGEPTLLNRDVPTLAYVWSATPVPDGTIFPSARYASLRYVHLHGVKPVGSWQQETRNVAADFRASFGRQPGALKYVAIFDDNDQTGEPASALFGKIVDAR